MVDPFATGLLACCVGRATRLVRFLSAEDKAYEGVIRLGFATDTGDATGEPLHEPRAPASLDTARELIAARLTGDLLQIPPMYSAKKVDGVALYRLARRGEHVEREAVPVRVRDWSLEAEGDGLLRFRVTCSAGTYVRVLAADLGDALGCGAHLASLRRTRSGDLRIEDSLHGDALDPDASHAALIPIERMPLALPRVRLTDEADVAAFLHGRSVTVSEIAAPAGSESGVAIESEVAVEAPGGRLIGIARAGGGRLQPSVVLGQG